MAIGKCTISNIYTCFAGFMYAFLHAIALLFSNVCDGGIAAAMREPMTDKFMVFVLFSGISTYVCTGQK